MHEQIKAAMGHYSIGLREEILGVHQSHSSKEVSQGKEGIYLFPGSFRDKAQTQCVGALN